MKRTPDLGDIAHAATHPLPTLAYVAGLVRGFAASMLRVAAGEKGPVVPGHLPGPVAAPVEEDVSTEDTVTLLEVAPERAAQPEDQAEDLPEDPTAI